MTLAPAAAGRPQSHCESSAESPEKRMLAGRNGKGSPWKSAGIFQFCINVPGTLATFVTCGS